jgi:hypothetical protein
MTAQGSFDAARSARQTASEAYLPTVTAVRDWIMTARNVFIKSFGTRWNTQWAQAGWTDKTTAIPARQDQQLSLIQRVANFLTTQPGYEVPSLNVTAHDATNLLTVALTAQQASTDAGIAQKTAGDSRDAAEEILRKSARMLINILHGVLAADDPRWEAFGLVMPAMNTAPGQPVNVTAHLDVTGAIVVTCDAVPLATRYRWRMLLVGVQTEYVLAASSTEAMAMIKDVAPGQLVRLIVQAVNGTRQGVASEPIEFTMPLAAAPEASKTQAPVLELPLVENTNGNGHGHANGTDYSNGSRAAARV